MDIGRSNQEPASPPLLHPRGVLPLVARGIVHDRRGARRQLAVERVRIGLLEHVPGARADLELVVLARLEIRQEDLPHAARHEVPHHVHAAVPPVEIANHADALGGWRPHREVHAAGVPQRHHVRSELLVGAQVTALAEQVHVEVGEHAPEVVGIAALHRDAAGEMGHDPVVHLGGRGRARDHRLEHTAGVGAFHRDVLRDGMHHAQRHLSRGGLEHADDQRVARLVAVRAQHAERIGEVSGGERVEDVSGTDGGGGGTCAHTGVDCTPRGRLIPADAGAPRGASTRVSAG